jgi:hypothetical protein
MNYKIIENEKQLKEFIDWLPELKDNEQYFVSLFARKKYSKEIIHSNDKTQLKRFTSKKDRLFTKIKQLECEIGSYVLKNGIHAPQESLVLYINPNPRDMVRATYNIMKKCIDLLHAKAKGYNLHAEALSSVQRSKGTSYFVDLDIDSKDIDLTKINPILPDKAYEILETRGGYHILVKTKNAPKTKWYQQLSSIYKIDRTGDQFLPIPGCVQGGFIPKFISKTTT